jgi:hypothetical protein
VRKASICIPSQSTAAIRLMAHALFNQRRYLEAIGAFRKLKTIALYEDEVDWNLMLCHWRLSKIDAGQRLDFEQAVKQLAKSQNPRYAAQAKKLMKSEKVK